MDPAAPPGVSLELVPSRIKEALACGMIAVVVSTAVYGITILQAYMYFRNNDKDSKKTKFFVAFLFFLDTVSLALAAEGLYEYAITDFGDPVLLLNMPPALAFEHLVTHLIAMLTQCFFAHLLWGLSKRNVVLMCTIVILSVCSFVPELVVSVIVYRNRDFFFLGSAETRTLGGVANGLSVVCDVLIAAALCYYLHSKRTGFKRTDSLIDKLMIYAVNRGGLTALGQAGELITTVALPARFIYLPFSLMSGKLYCNTLLATLNAQRSIRGDGTNVIEVDTVFLNRMNGSTAGHENSRSSAGESGEGMAGEGKPPFVLEISRKTVGAVHTPSVDSEV